MKQSEKNKRSREYILQYAFTEFAAHGYAGGAINQICTQGSISKGLLYHYYDNKDALYLACVELLFRDMTIFLQDHIHIETVTIKQYFEVRMQFFQQYPAHRQLFYDVLVYPQSHLSQQLEHCRAEFDALNTQMLRTVLQQAHLSASVSLEAAIRQFRAFVNFLGVYIREDSLADAEQKTRELLNTMLYGLVAR
ncbi:MAG: TetR/AcrR family transcriptional regulator [Agathobaculum sp.]|jgi:TetR/AcrR family transcriptional regulator|uniref:TetR/AcrR family transcriptional regulator n=1 Tax=Agathobaculum sp. TaxID=2048138 RepID=UPI003D8D2719